jgi:glucan phosphoethanolaminetransferase (alkaline phosphatase superfamily)
VWVSTGHAIEGNPLLWDLPEHFPLTFVTVKTSLVSLGTLLLWRYRARPLSVVALFVAFLAYYFLLLYHLAAMNLRLVARVAEWLNS